MRGLLIRKLLSGLVAGGAIAALLSTGTTATAAPQDLKTVPFEVSGELPIYPKALWKNGSSGTNVRKVEARLVQLKLLEKRYLDNEFGTMTPSVFWLGLLIGRCLKAQRLSPESSRKHQSARRSNSPSWLR